MIFNKLLTDPKNVLQRVFDSIEKQEQQLITYLNQHCFNIYYENDVYRKVLDKKFIVYQADVGVFLALKFLLKEKLKRIDATEMNKLILDKLIKKNIPLVFVGGDFDDKFVQEESSKRGINLVKYQNGFFNEDQTENVINNLNESNSQVFIIGMGVPKQEIFAAKLAQVHGQGTFICVGNFLEFYLGTKKRTHSIFRETGFEWLFRLITEPARLWKRYLIGIPLFIYRIFKIKSQDEILELQK